MASLLATSTAWVNEGIAAGKSGFDYNGSDCLLYQAQGLSAAVLLGNDHSHGATLVANGTVGILCMAAHHPVTTGWFLINGGSYEVSTSRPPFRLGTTDLLFVALDRKVDGVSPMKILPNDSDRLGNGVSLPCVLVVPRRHQIVLGLMAMLWFSRLSYGMEAGFNIPSGGAEWHLGGEIVDGDSGSPVTVIVNGEVVFLGPLHTRNNCGSLTYYKNDIEAAWASYWGITDTLTEVDLTSFSSLTGEEPGETMATLTVAVSGNWNEGPTWGNAVGGATPTVVDAVVVPTGKKVTIPAAVLATCASCTLNGTGAMDVDNGGILTTTGDLLLGSGKITRIGAEATFNIGDEYKKTGSGGGYFTESGAGTTTVNVGTLADPTVTIYATDPDATVVVNATTLTPSASGTSSILNSDGGNLVVSVTNPVNPRGTVAYFNGTTGSLTFNGTIVPPGVTGNTAPVFEMSGSGDMTINCQINTNLNSGVAGIAVKLAESFTGTFTCNGIVMAADGKGIQNNATGAPAVIINGPLTASGNLAANVALDHVAGNAAYHINGLWSATGNSKLFTYTAGAPTFPSVAGGISGKVSELNAIPNATIYLPSADKVSRAVPSGKYGLNSGTNAALSGSGERNRSR